MGEELQEKFRTAVGKIRHALPKSLDEVVDTVRVRIHQEDPYLSEVATSKRYDGGKEHIMLRMTPEELESCRVHYDPHGLLLQKDGKLADTFLSHSKG